MIYPIRYFGDPILRQVARPVTKFGPALDEFAQNMVETMYDANGLGLAAPQVGRSLRLFVALETEPVPNGGGEEMDSDTLSPEEKRELWGVTAVHVLANPEITRRSGVQTGQDGCLSVPGLYIDALERDESITLQYQDLTGRQRTLNASGRFAHVLQHEHDHLEGILFFDRLPTAERREFMATHRAELAEIQRDAKALLRSLKRPVGTASGR